MKCLLRIFLAVLAVLPAAAIAQPVFKQVTVFPTFGESLIFDDHVLLTGYYFDPIDFDDDGQPDTSNRGGSDIFLARYSLNADWHWVQTAGGTEPAYLHPLGGLQPNDRGHAIVTDLEGNIYISGIFDEAADFDHDELPDVHNTYPDTSGIFLAKYSPAGTLQWVTQFEGVSGNTSKLLYSAARNSLYLAVAHYDDLYNSPRNTTLHLMEVSLEGSIEWQKSMPPVLDVSESYLQISDMKIDRQGYIYITGGFNGTVDLDGPEESLPISTGADVDYSSTYLVKYNPTGHLLWVKTSIDTGSSWGYAMELDEDRNIFVAGRFSRGATSFEDDGKVFSGLGGDNNIYLVCFSPKGELKWAAFPTDLHTNPFGGAASSMYTFDIALHASGVVLISGGINGIMDMDGDGQADIDTTPSNSSIGYIAAYTMEGTYSWIWNTDTTSVLFDISAQQNGDLYLASGFFGSIDIDGPGGLNTVYSADSVSYGHLLAQFELQDQPLPVDLTNFAVTADGTAALLSWTTASEINNAGFEILHNGKPLGEFIPGTGTTVEPQFYSYRMDNLPAGAHRFQLKQIDFDGAFSLSQEITLWIGLQEAFQLTAPYPNPFNPQTTFSLAVAQEQEVEIALYDLLGRRVQLIFEGFLQPNETRQFLIDGSSLPSGTYLYHVKGAYFSSSSHIVLLK